MAEGWVLRRLQIGKPDSIEVDMVIGADGANSRVAKAIDAGDYDYAIAFQVRGTSAVSRESWLFERSRAHSIGVWRY